MIGEIKKIKDFENVSVNKIATSFHDNLLVHIFTKRSIYCGVDHFKMLKHTERDRNVIWRNKEGLEQMGHLKTKQYIVF